jgi:AraC family transcriptional regulator
MADNTFEFLQKAIDYIEDNLKEVISLDDLAANTNMSKFHLSRVFKALTNYSPVEYIRRRKLSDSLYQLLNTNLKIIDIATEYGFQYEQTYIRSFSNYFNISPDRFRREKPALEITDKYDLSGSKFICKDGIIILPKFIVKPTFKLVGIKYNINLNENSISHILTDLAHDFYYNMQPMIKNSKHKNVYWGYINDVVSDNSFRYYTTSIEVNSLDGIPEEMVGATIPSRKYAVFKYIGMHNPHKITISHIQSIYNYIFSQWFNICNYKIIDNFSFERVNMDICREDYCELDMYFPIAFKD